MDYNINQIINSSVLLLSGVGRKCIAERTDSLPRIESSYEGVLQDLTPFGFVNMSTMLILC